MSDHSTTGDDLAPLYQAADEAGLECVASDASGRHVVVALPDVPWRLTVAPMWEPEGAPLDDAREQMWCARVRLLEADGVQLKLSERLAGHPALRGRPSRVGGLICALLEVPG